MDTSVPPENVITPPVEPVTEPPVIPHKHFPIAYLLIPIILLGGMAVMLTTSQQTRDIRSKASNNSVTLALSPTTKSAKIGETISVGLTINTKEDGVSAAELHLTYDPTALEIVSFTPGTPLPVVLVPETHAGGTIAVTLGSQATAPFKGAGILGTWSVKVLTQKTSTLSITDATQIAAIGKTTNALASKSDSTITGSASGGVIAPTPTITSGNKLNNAPTSTPTPNPTSAGSDNTSFGQITRPTTTQNATTVLSRTILTTTPSNITPATQQTTQEQPLPATEALPTTEPAIPQTTTFQQILSGILTFFQKLFQK